MAVGGCNGPDAANSGSAHDELRQAVDATLASTSFVVHWQGEGEPADDGEMTVIFQAPDRARASDSAGLDTIAVGRTLYSNRAKPGTGPDLFYRPAVPVLPNGAYAQWSALRAEPPYVDNLLEQIRLPGMATTVERTGSTYRWRAVLAPGTVSGEAHVVAGRLSDFTVRADTRAAEGFVTTLRFSDYDRAPAVEAPPADRVIDPPDLAPCGEDGRPPPGHGVCGDGQVIGGFAGMPDLEPCEPDGTPPADRLICGTGRQVEGTVGTPAPPRPEPVDQTIADLLKDPPPQPAH